MIRGTARLLASPMARPPGRRSWASRFAPELAAAAAWLAALLAMLAAERAGSGRALEAGVLTGLAAGGALTLVGALVSGSRALARERDLGTLEALLLTSTNHAALVRGRFWCVTLPWLRLFVYLLPFYLGLAASEVLDEATGGHEALILSLFSAFSSRVNMVLLLAGDTVGFRWRYLHAWGVFIVLVRWVNHVSVFMFAAAAAYWISARARSADAALLVASIAVPASLASLLGLHELFVGGAIMNLFNWRGWMTWIYALLIAVCVTARTVLTWYLLCRAERDFGPDGAGPKGRQRHQVASRPQVT